MVDELNQHQLKIVTDGEEQVLAVQHGANLRRTLLGAGLSPYATLTRYANCGGRGLCATCGVSVDSGEPIPIHWHDRIGSRFGYPRLSCQITIERDMTVRLLTDKWVWGRRDLARTRRTASDK
ncbi:MAG: 2Fe-2S iron-sulfur cluster binding domain-containing protein [Chitinophagaceae bacterium]|nr:2Fe-2S iron-sulfur cluster binding domain-containing protein [Anaerolineae bacterium]